jgi:hypothetical protein
MQDDVQDYYVRNLPELPVPCGERTTLMAQARHIGDTETAARPAQFKRLAQWAMLNEHTYLPTGETSAKLRPGVYEIAQTDSGVVFQEIPVKTEGLIRFPQSNSETVIEDIQKFWQREHLFREFNLTYKRGILVYGPPGSGKSCTLQFLCADVIARGGIVVKFNHPYLFSQGMRKMRDIEPETPVVGLMEDLDSLLEHHSETEVLNILDGIDSIDRIVFLASTNYPERLGGRIVNRPSRFDKRVFIGHPNDESRSLYLHFLLEDKGSHGVDIACWAADTRGFSIAHLKELFISVVIQGDDYQETLGVLRGMGKMISSSDGETRAGIRQ